MLHDYSGGGTLTHRRYNYLLQFHIPFFNPSSFPQRVADQRCQDRRQNEGNQDQPRPVECRDGRLGAVRDILHPTAVDTDLAHKAAGAHSGGDRRAVHAEMEEAGGQRTRDG